MEIWTPLRDKKKIDLAYALSYLGSNLKYTVVYDIRSDPSDDGRTRIGIGETKK